MSVVAAHAIDVAREALLESAPSAHVGEHFSVETSDVDGANIAIHAFECTNAAYIGWYWAVSVVTVPDQDHATVSEVNLLPGAAALVPAAWVAWSERVQPGDLGVGDLLPPPAHDVRLTAGFTDVVLDGNDISDEMRDLAAPAWELGLGRESVLSVQGREMAIARWMGGQTGPRAAMAKAAPAQCSSCGFLVAVGGSLGQAFGICANEFGAADGSLVAMTFGCGAHSSVTIDGHSPVPVVELAIDDDADERSDASDLPEYVANAPEAVDGDASESDDSEKDAEDSDERSLDRLSLGDEVADSDSDALGDEDSDDSEEDSEDDDEESNPDGLVEGHISDFLDHIDEDSDHVQMVDDDFEDDYEDERR